MNTSLYDTNFLTNTNNDHWNPDIFTSIEAFQDRYFDGKVDNIWFSPMVE